MVLLTLSDQQRIKPIDNNSIHKFEQLRNEVEINDLQKYVGREFYQELIRNANNYEDLLNGGSYIEDGVTYYFRGFRYVLAYLLYARYVRESYLNDTFSGMMAHTVENGQRVSAGELRTMEERYREMSATLWDECRRYLCAIGNPYFRTLSRTKTKFDYL